MAEKRMFPFQDRMVPGEPIDFQATIPEGWNNYQLDDGTTMKIKTVLLNVARLDEFDQQGNPVYTFQAQQIVAINPPERLKKTTDGKIQ